MSQLQSSMLMDHQEWSGLQLLHYFQPLGHCACPRALVNSRSGSLSSDAVVLGLLLMSGQDLVAEVEEEAGQVRT